MRLKTFTAPSMTEAMNAVKRVMGDEAVIISSGQDKKTKMFTVTAALDENISSTSVASTAALKNSLPSTPNLAPKPTFKSAITVQQPEDSEAIDAAADALDTHACPRKLANRLLRFAEESEQTTAEAILAEGLSRLFQFKTIENLWEQTPQPVMLVGPAAAGKTLSTAKLAAKSVMTGEKVVVITSDTAKAGGVEQLSLLTRILEVPLHTIEDSPALQALLLQHQHPKEHLYIDTQGTNPFLKKEMAEIKTLYKSYPNIHAILVLPAGIDPLDARDMAASFASEITLSGIIFTRLDQARRLGSLLTAADAAQVPILGAGISQKVIHGLQPLNSRVLARLLLQDLTKPKVNAFMQ